MTVSDSKKVCTACTQPAAQVGASHHTSPQPTFPRAWFRVAQDDNVQFLSLGLFYVRPECHRQFPGLTLSHYKVLAMSEERYLYDLALSVPSSRQSCLLRDEVSDGQDYEWSFHVDWKPRVSGSHRGDLVMLDAQGQKLLDVYVSDHRGHGLAQTETSTVGGGLCL
eukprot:gb/GECG01009235.1/.p1 GENE.gb/GECG01009235.1/~~gb/GECG01009235.1/.p1  ORF type:complete len:166 (+),score=3.70 gb/GECG01009235.1/:1-498(+)